MMMTTSLKNQTPKLHLERRCCQILWWHEGISRVSKEKTTESENFLLFHHLIGHGVSELIQK